jgi:hypothetical protein
VSGLTPEIIVLALLCTVLELINVKKRVKLVAFSGVEFRMCRESLSYAIVSQTDIADALTENSRLGNRCEGGTQSQHSQRAARRPLTFTLNNFASAP